MNSVWTKITDFVNGSMGLGLLLPEEPIKRVELANRGVVWFFVFNLLLFFLFRSHLAALFEFSEAERHYGHVVLIPLVVLYLLYRHGHRILARTSWSPASGAAIGVLGVVVYTVAGNLVTGLSRNDYLALATLGLVLIWIGGFIAILGVRAARAAQFPICLLVFAIPIPDLLLQKVVSFLQLGSVEVTAFILRLLPIPVYHEGTRFLLPNLAIDVTTACSGIRSALALFVTSLLAGHLLLRSNWSRTALALAAIPIAILKNGLRIVTLCLLALYVDEGFLDGSLHTRGGYPFFILSLVMMFPLLWFLQRAEMRSAQRISEEFGERTGKESAAGNPQSDGSFQPE